MTSLRFDELPCPDDVFSVRLAERDGSPVLLAASMIDRVPHARPCEPGGVPFRLGPPPFSVYAAWDARFRDGSWDSVVTVAGSSLCDLAVRDRDGEASTREWGHRCLYREPRFFRESAVRWRAVAVSTGSADRLMLLERDGAGRLASRTLLEAPPSGDFKCAVVLGEGTDRLLCHASYFQGSVRPDRAGAIPHRTLWRHESETLSSVLCLPLDESLSPAGPASRPFGDGLVFQVDAAPTSDGRAVLFATTESGYRVAVGRVRGADFDGPREEGVVPGAELVSPTVLVLGDRIHVAAIAVRGNQRTLLRAETKG